MPYHGTKYSLEIFSAFLDSGNQISMIISSSFIHGSTISFANKNINITYETMKTMLKTFEGFT